MSSPLAIAAVTQVMKGLLVEKLSSSTSEVATILDEVTALPPAKIDISIDNEPNQLNLYMYMTSPNQGWSNRNFPSHNAQGQRMTNPFLALDLHYVLSAYGNQELNAEMLLGYAMQAFHENPVLAKEFIRLELTTPPLSTAGLAEQIEQVKITPQILSTEETSRIWTAFGAKHRPSAYYKATAVLIESKKPARVALPVRKPLLYVRPFKQPLISKVSSRTDANAPIIDNQKILANYQLVVKGNQLKGEVNSLLISGQEQSIFIELKDDQLVAQIPAGLKAGLQSVQVIHKINLGQPATPRHGFTSNAEAFVLSPEISGNISQVNVQVNGNTQKALRLQIIPLPDNTQQISLFLNQLNSADPAEYRFEKDFSQVLNPTTPAGRITIPINGVTPGNYLVRVRVDNAESWMAANYQSPAVTIT